jgi:hypothetical protein
MSTWRVAIIPYDLSVPLNYYCKPLKLYEYFYLGLPVVSVPIKSITNYSSLVSFATTTDEWVSSIKQLLRKKFSKKELEFMREEALKNSWQNKLDFIFSKLE